MMFRGGVESLTLSLAFTLQKVIFYSTGQCKGNPATRCVCVAPAGANARNACKLRCGQTTHVVLVTQRA